MGQQFAERRDVRYRLVRMLASALIQSTRSSDLGAANVAYEALGHLLAGPKAKGGLHRRRRVSLLPGMQAFEAKPPPLVTGEDGVIRVVGTRVPLETVVASFDAGATAEEIVQQYPTLQLADVYATLSYILDNDASVRRYVATRQATARALRDQIESQQPADGTRQRLNARRRRAASE